MKIALPTIDNKIDDHFGHCEYFTIYSVNNREIISEAVIKSPEGCGCKSNIAQTLAESGVEVMLAGNMGEGAVNVLGSHGIKVLRGCSGNVKEVAENWLNGKLQDSGDVCHQHECH
ncbi:MAG: NifB/NifX family molybdenum-iron cluster-binding protein [Candidatus Margulisbacteria bacterium]|nr:NifB/NifX family molybdenum-iron cluster-binding protein [Candidatus Margulisiibacteriota bacterium]